MARKRWHEGCTREWQGRGSAGTVDAIGNDRSARRRKGETL